MTRDDEADAGAAHHPVHHHFAVELRTPNQVRHPPGSRRGKSGRPGSPHALPHAGQARDARLRQAQILSGRSYFKYVPRKCLKEG